MQSLASYHTTIPISHRLPKVILPFYSQICKVNWADPSWSFDFAISLSLLVVLMSNLGDSLRHLALYNACIAF